MPTDGHGYVDSAVNIDYKCTYFMSSITSPRV